ncbi:MAG: molybdopterin molybdotransferase MoeA [Deferribacterales bacterium]
MISWQEAKSILNSLVTTYGTEKVSVRESWGRTLAEDITVPRDYPDVNKSAVDGYAFRHGRKTYRLTGEVAAGEKSGPSVKDDETIFVMTGGTVPHGADTVARVEDCEEKDGVVSIPESIPAGDSVNLAGEEARKGEAVIRKGAVIDKGLYPALFYLGKAEVEVYKKPRVAAFVTGDEILEVEEKFTEGMVFDTNRRILESCLNSVGITPDFFGPIGDTEAEVANAFKEMCRDHDIIISSGGVSMGKYDFVKKVFKEHDFELFIERTRIKPGSPLMVAKRDNKLFLGMPGYPAAFLTNFVFYAVPLFRKALGVADFENKIHKAVLKTEMKARKGRMDVDRAVVTVENGRYCAADPGSQLTSHFINFATVNGLVLIDEDTNSLPAGSEADMILIP